MNETLQTEEEFYLCSFSRKQDIDEIDNLDYPILQTIVMNTNIYAAVHNAKHDTNQADEGQNWTNLTLNEFKIWLAFVIYMEVFKFLAITDYWKKDKPLASHIKNILKQLYLSASNLSLDEMNARFSGRSAHMFRIKNKPTPEGYKILSLCDSGYTYTFMFLSRIMPSSIELIPNLNKTGSEVYHLVKQLPQGYAFNIYMDNFFSSINLYQFLREKGFGACGTIRTNTTRFPWDYLIGVVVDDVLSFLWIDNSPVTMLTIIYKIDGQDSKIKKNRRKLHETSTNYKNIRSVFGDEVRKVIPILVAIDDYNYYMGGVDIADQLRSYYSTQLTVFRVWVPLFFWLLDTAIINSYLICKKLNIAEEHKAFRLALIRDLIKNFLNPLKRTTQSGDNNVQIIEKDNTNVNKKFRVSANFELPLCRLVGNSHYPEYRESDRGACL
ncbi:4989_t:CDS:2 [Cetraspora pellucida]|uniref:4989_t:CDS:1 n=1 Tax=Cetraspora pellucida TaxID=1433469 RepID=A0A9N9N2E7_9GLOM|nr:4989_t:CDS:2 [Cetraspora pellucida]